MTFPGYLILPWAIPLYTVSRHQLWQTSPNTFHLDSLSFQPGQVPRITIIGFIDHSPVNFRLSRKLSWGYMLRVASVRSIDRIGSCSKLEFSGKEKIESVQIPNNYSNEAKTCCQFSYQYAWLGTSTGTRTHDHLPVLIPVLMTWYPYRTCTHFYFFLGLVPVPVFMTWYPYPWSGSHTHYLVPLPMTWFPYPWPGSLTYDLVPVPMTW